LAFVCLPYFDVILIRAYFGGFWCYFNLEFSPSRLYNDTKHEQMFAKIRRPIEFRLAEKDYIEDLC